MKIFSSAPTITWYDVKDTDEVEIVRVKMFDEPEIGSYDLSYVWARVNGDPVQFSTLFYEYQFNPKKWKTEIFKALERWNKNRNKLPFIKGLFDMGRYNWS